MMIAPMSFIPNVGVMINPTTGQIMVGQQGGRQGQYGAQGVNKGSKKQKFSGANHRAGDWVCLICNNHNYSFREVCNRCGVQTKKQNLIQSLALIENSNQNLACNFQNYNYCVPGNQNGGYGQQWGGESGEEQQQKNCFFVEQKLKLKKTARKRAKMADFEGKSEANTAEEGGSGKDGSPIVRPPPGLATFCLSEGQSNAGEYESDGESEGEMAERGHFGAGNIFDAFKQVDENRETYRTRLRDPKSSYDLFSTNLSFQKREILGTKEEQGGHKHEVGSIETAPTESKARGKDSLKDATDVSVSEFKV